MGKWKALRSILFGRARIDLEEELNPVIVAIIVIALYLRVLATTRGLNSIIDANVDDLTRLLARRSDLNVGELIQALHHLVFLQVVHLALRTFSGRVEIVQIQR